MQCHSQWNAAESYFHGTLGTQSGSSSVSWSANWGLQKMEGYLNNSLPFVSKSDLEWKWGRRYICQVEMWVQQENAVSLNGCQSAYTSGYLSVSIPQVECVINWLLHVQLFLDSIFQTIEAPAELVFFSVTHSLPCTPSNPYLYSPTTLSTSQPFPPSNSLMQASCASLQLDLCVCCGGAES